jgi:hypothetical protein
VANEYWFYFDIYSSGQWLGRSRVFKIVGKDTRQEATAAAEEEWLRTGALAGTAYELRWVTDLTPNSCTLRDHEESPTKE